MRYFVAILRFAITRKSGAKIENTRLAKTFVAIFALAKRLTTSAILNSIKIKRLLQTRASSSRLFFQVCDISRN